MKHTGLKRNLKNYNMKRLTFILIIGLFAYSCTKQRPAADNPNAVAPTYLGTYDSANGDTAYVTQNDKYISIGWANHLGNRRIYFDSTNVNSDSTFTVNQIVNHYLWVYERAIGTGRFYNNTLQFDIRIYNARVTFSGIKRN